MDINKIAQAVQILEFLDYYIWPLGPIMFWVLHCSHDSKLGKAKGVAGAYLFNYGISSLNQPLNPVTHPGHLKKTTRL